MYHRLQFHSSPSDTLGLSGPSSDQAEALEKQTDREMPLTAHTLGLNFGSPPASLLPEMRHNFYLNCTFLKSETGLMTHRTIYHPNFYL